MYFSYLRICNVFQTVVKFFARNGRRLLFMNVQMYKHILNFHATN